MLLIWRHIARVLVVTHWALVLTAADQAWKNKQYPEWTEQDAKEVITSSPWVKTVTPTIEKNSVEDRRKRSGGGYKGNGIGIGIPGMRGMGRRGGASSGEDQIGRSGTGVSSSAPSTSSSAPILTLTLRWESALPVREAELKARETSAPTVDDDHYGIAVYGTPRSMVANDSKELAEELKKHAILKRETKKDLRPSSVEILLREDGPVILYLFPKTAEITWRDQHLQFEAQVSNLKFSLTFETIEMRFHGNLEL
jgi:hypothetical protein